MQPCKYCGEPIEMEGVGTTWFAMQLRKDGKGYTRHICKKFPGIEALKSEKIDRQLEYYFKNPLFLKAVAKKIKADGMEADFKKMLDLPNT